MNFFDLGDDVARQEKPQRDIGMRAPQAKTNLLGDHFIGCRRQGRCVQYLQSRFVRGNLQPTDRRAIPPPFAGNGGVNSHLVGPRG